MTKKAKPKAKRQLTTAEAFYVEQHAGKKDAKQIAKEIKVPAKLVADYIAALPDVEIQQEKSGPEKAGYAVYDGTTSMTGAASEKADKQETPGEEFYRKRVPGLHVINPNLPTR